MKDSKVETKKKERDNFDIRKCYFKVEIKKDIGKIYLHIKLNLYSFSSILIKIFIIAKNRNRKLLKTRITHQNNFSTIFYFFSCNNASYGVITKNFFTKSRISKI